MSKSFLHLLEVCYRFSDWIFFWHRAGACHPRPLLAQSRAAFNISIASGDADVMREYQKTSSRFRLLAPLARKTLFRFPRKGVLYDKCWIFPRKGCAWTVPCCCVLVLVVRVKYVKQPNVKSAHLKLPLHWNGLVKEPPKRDFWRNLRLCLSAIDAANRSTVHAMARCRS